MLKFGIALLSWLVVPTVLIEAANGSPGTVSTGLTSLGIEQVRKRVLFGKHGTIALEVIFVDATTVHPQAYALIADELYDSNGFIDSRILLPVPIEFVLLYEHARFAFRVFSARLIIHQKKVYCQGESYEFNLNQYLPG